MITIRSLLDVLDELALDSPIPIVRLCELRELRARSSRAKREALARSYRGDFMQFLADLRKQDLVCLLAVPITLDGVDHNLPSAGRYRKEELVDIASDLYFCGRVPPEVVPMAGEEEAESGRGRRGPRGSATSDSEDCPCGSGEPFSGCHGDPRGERARARWSETHTPPPPPPPPPRGEAPPRPEGGARNGADTEGSRSQERPAGGGGVAGLHPNETLALALTSLTWPASSEVLRAAQRAIARVLHPDRLAADAAAARTAAEALGRVNDGFTRLQRRA
jgi:hypothetical protein